MRKLLPLLLFVATGAHAAFPTVESSTGTDFGAGSANSSVDFTNPSTVNDGDLLIYNLACRDPGNGAPAITEPGTVTALDEDTYVVAGGSNELGYGNYYDVADGTEDGATVTFNLGGSSYCVGNVWRISGWADDASGIESSGETEFNSTAPDSASLNPTGWGTEDTLWLTIAYSYDDDPTLTTTPTNYTNGTLVDGGRSANSNAQIWHARRENATASEDPGAFTISQTEQGAAYTIAIRPVTASNPTFTSNPVLDSCSSTGCTFDYTADAASDTLYAMFTDTAASAPTCDAIEALTGNHGDANESTTGSADSITVPADVDTPRFPIYDAHFCIEDSGGLDSSVVTVSDVTLDDQTNSHYIQLDAVTGTLAADFNTAVDPDIVAGDWLNVPDDLTPGIKGEHDGSGNAATLTDSSKSWTVDALIAKTITNDTDGSSCEITDNDATTVTCTLSGGTDNDWDVDDAYTIPIAYDGTHDGSGNAATLTDTDQAWTTNALVDLEVMNTTDGSQCEITANTATTITCTLAGGTDNDWDVSDAYEIGLVDHDADIVYSDGGDGTQQRAYDIDVYDVSAGDWHASDIDFIANNNAPVCDPTDFSPVVLTEDVAMSTIDFDNPCTDADFEDQPTYTVTTGTLPTGTSLGGTGSSEWTGTPTTEDEAGTAITITATDIASTTDTLDFTVYVVNTVTLPTLDDSDLDAATTDMENAFPWRVDSLGLTATFSCGAEAANQVLSQDPAAATEVTAYQEITVVVSTGSVCATFSLTGLPLSGDWEPWYDVSLLNEFVTIKQQECDGDAVWAKWRAGTSVSPRGSANCVVQENLIKQEADGSAVWARWAPNTTIRNSAMLQIDIRAALTADFVVN